MYKYVYFVYVRSIAVVERLAKHEYIPISLYTIFLTTLTQRQTFAIKETIYYFDYAESEKEQLRLMRASNKIRVYLYVVQVSR